MKGKLFIISGPSGVGKDTIADAQIQNPLSSKGRVLRRQGLKIQKLSTYTTRSPRPREKEDKEYYFVSKKEFEKLNKDGKILEYNIYNSDFYGTPRKDLEEALDSGKNILLVVDVNGGLNIKKEYPKSVLIFLKSDLSDIRHRLEKRRQNSETEIKKRLQIAKNELKSAKNYDFVVENKEGYPEKAIKEIEKIIIKIIAITTKKIETTL